MKKVYSGIILMLTLLITVTGLNQSIAANKVNLSKDEVYKISKEATVYGYPTVEFYRIMYQQAVNTSDPQFKAPFNQIKSIAEAAGPKDSGIQTINADTPYSYLWLDLRNDAMVITLPKIDKNRYYSTQIIDSYTYDVDYLGTRKDGNDGGQFLIAGPKWNGEVPAGIKRVVKVNTEFAYVIFRTQLLSDKDLSNVAKIQAGYKVQTLDEYLGKIVDKKTSVINWLPISKDDEFKPENFYTYLNTMLQYMPEYADEKALRAEFAKIGVVPGKKFDMSGMTPDQQKAVSQGMQDALKEIQTKLEASPDSKGFFGTKETMKNNYMMKSMAAMGGLFGNIEEEAMYIFYLKDSNGVIYDTSKNNYILHFDKDKLPPVKAFWSITMYEKKTYAMVENPLNRYLMNSAMLPDFKKDKNGGIDIYIQKTSPGKNLESNWLPAPDGEFYMVLRAYLPDETLINGSWQKPELQINKK